MDIKTELPADVAASLDELYHRAREYNPRLTMAGLMAEIVCQWLELYRAYQVQPQVKDQVRLRNDLKIAISLSGKSQRQVAREIGICHTHLSQIVNGKNDPSVTVALLIAQAIGWPPARFCELFYLDIKE